MKPAKLCNVMSCTDCFYYSNCTKNYIDVEVAKGKYSFRNYSKISFLLKTKNR